MTKSTTDAGARETCALSVTARPIPHEIAGRRFWPSHVRMATAAAMLAPIATVLASGAMSAYRRDVGALGGEQVFAARSRNVVAGRILDASGHSAAGASVRVVSCDAGARSAAVTTDAEGRFRIDGFAGRGVRIIAEDDDTGFVESAELDAEGARGIVLVLGHASKLTGVVTDERGAPVAQAVVKSWGGSSGTEKLVTADDEGHYVLDRVAPNADRVTAWARGFEASTFVVPRAAPVTTTLDVRLAASPAIRGHVLGPTGRAVAGARVVACEDGAIEAAISDAAGAFELPAATIGCVVNASHPRFASARRVMIESAAELAIRLGAAGAIEGAAVDGRGEPINSFSVAIESFDPAEGESKESSRAGESRDELRGSFRFDDLAAGTYVIRATTREGLASEAETVVVARAKVARGVVLRFAPQAAVDAQSAAESSEGRE